MTFAKALGAWAAAHVLPVLILAGGLLLVSQIVLARFEASQRAILKEQVDAEKQIAAAFQAVQGQQVKVISVLDPNLKAFLEQEKKAGAKPIEAGQTGVTISDTAKGTVGPQYVEDQYGRFRFDLKTGDLQRTQKFELDSLIVRSADGKYSWQKSAFKEFSPLDGSEIPTAGAKVDEHFQFVEEKPQFSPWHLRLVVLGGTPGWGAGAQVNPWSGLLLTLGGAYGKANGLAAVGGVGWRLRFPWLDTTLGLSLLGSYGKGGSRIGGGATAELTR